MFSITCPTPEDLSVYAAGKVSEERIEAIAAHVERCGPCQTTLATLASGDDSVSSRLRKRFDSNVSIQDPQLQSLLERAKALGLDAAALVPTLTTTPAAAGMRTQLDQYRMLEKIGEGGMGIVYKAMHMQLEKIVALKVLPPMRGDDPNAVARFKREVQAVGKLDHPHIVRALDAREANGVYFLVMEYVEGIDLMKLLRRLGPLPIADACALACQAAEGLQHAYEHHLVHRDIKPSNLMLCGDGRLKVLDLGLARLRGAGQESEDLTAPGQMMGTVDYMAPEQTTDAATVDIRADIYSLGCTLYHLLAGRTPFADCGHPARKLAAQMNVPPPSIRSFRSEIPDDLGGILERMLAKDPADRFATPADAAAALRPFARNADLLGLLSRFDPRPGSKDTEKIATAGTKDKEAFSTAHSSPRKPNEEQSTPSFPEPLRPAARWTAAPSAPSPRKFIPGQKIALLTGGVVLFAAALLCAFLGNWMPSKQPGAKVELDAAGNEGPAEKGADAKAQRESPSKVKKVDKDSEPPNPVADLAEEGVGFLNKYCYRCHGVDFKAPGLNVMDRDVLTGRRKENELAYLAPGKPDQSYLWQRVGIDADMPPSGKEPSDAEKQLFKQWIEAGAPYPGRPARPFRSEATVLASIRDHLREVKRDARPFQRYFTFTHLYNNNRHVGTDELRLYGAALGKIINSLSWKPSIVVPRAIDPDETVFQLDLRDLGWDEAGPWEEIIKVYPYGLTHRNDTDEGLRDLAREVYDLAGNDLPYIRADWFIATASRPPLYHVLLQLPANARILERQLKVDVENDFLRNKLARAGMVTSGVSKQNRIVDRHDAVYGAYWKSYDFKTNEGRGNLIQFPLGPGFADNPYADHAFQHAGGEIIFSLPNRLQGYLLIDEQERRIDQGPIEVVRDSQEIAGTPQIVNGLSCMACHKHGVIRFSDKLRDGSAVRGDVLEKVRQLFRAKEEMERLITKDEECFLRALDEATGPFLKVGPDRGKNLREFPEPVGAIARLYLKDLGLDDVAFELGIEPDRLKTLLRDNRRLRELGLGPLLEGGTIKRAVWSSLENVTSLFHNVARELGLGTPHVSF